MRPRSTSLRFLFATLGAFALCACSFLIAEKTVSRSAVAPDGGDAADVGSWLDSAKELDGETGGDASNDGAVPSDRCTLFAAGLHTCAVLPARADGGLVCWGGDPDPYVYEGDAAAGCGTYCAPTQANKTIKTFAMGYLPNQLFWCFVKTDDHVACRGANAFGQLGNDDSTFRDSQFPVSVANDFHARQIAADSNFVCAIDLNAEVWCWGSNEYLQLGVAANHSSLKNCGDAGALCAVAPIRTGITGAKNIVLGSRHACALLESKQLVCWGDNAAGIFGQGVGAPRSTPVTVPLPGDVDEVATSNDHACALVSGEIYCWGNNASLQVGSPPGDGGLYLPVTKVLRSENVATPIGIGAGTSFSCLLANDGKPSCWGQNIDNKLGRPTAGNTFDPLNVPNAEGIVQIVTSETHTCALASDKTVHCWGSGGHGELGIEATLSLYSSTPIYTCP